MSCLRFFLGTVVVLGLACSSPQNDPSNGDGAGGAPAGSGGGETDGAGGVQAASGGGRAAGGAPGAGGDATNASGGGAATGGAESTGGASASGGAPQDPTCQMGLGDGTPQVLSLSGNTFAHDPTMIRAGDTYYRFWTGDFIPSATSSDLLDWDNAPTVYDGNYPAWSDAWLAGVSNETFNFPWAPDVSAFDGRVHLYSSFSARFGDNVSCITHLSTPNIAEGPWTDHGPVLCTEGNEPYNAIDADVGFDEEGAAYLAFGSFWDGIFATPLAADGSIAQTDLTRLAWAQEIEAPVLFRRCGYYYLFVTWGLCCPGEGRSVDQLSYRVAVGRAESILGPYTDREGKPMIEGGGTLVVQGDDVKWAAAGHSDVLVDGDQVYHVYHAYAQSNGAASLRIAELFFDEDGWPVAHAP